MTFFNRLIDSRPIVLNSTRQVRPVYDGVRDKAQIKLYPSNFIVTSRYNMITFLPMSFLQQFSRYSNFYFLVTAIVQSISIISPLNPFSAIAPLIFVLGLSMSREGYEDFMRHKSDYEVNATQCQCIVDNIITNTTWADIQVGDLIFIEENQPFPADILVLGSSYENGVCYVETSSLDGEKNLKPKGAIQESQQLFKNYENIEQSNIYVFAQAPTQALYEFEGQIQIQNNKYMLGPKQLLLRGAYLRNTKWIIGLVLYTGQDTKIMRNAEPSRVKQSEIESIMNKLILGILAVQFTLCLLSAILCSVWLSKNWSGHNWYLQFVYNQNTQALIAFFSYFLLYNTMIPISLNVSLEFVKVFQSYFIGTDEEMYVASRDKYASVKTTTINEELGQVEYIFSDKTGTLTCNQMEFKYCIVGDILYGQIQDEPQETMRKLDKNNSNPKSIHPVDEEVYKHTVFNFTDKDLMDVINDQNCQNSKLRRNIVFQSNDQQQQIEISNQRELVDYFFFLLSSAHECLSQIDKHGNQIYQGPSPDEITLVDAAANLGYIFVGSSANEQNFLIQGIKKRVELLKLFEFDSDRKRMSVIIREQGVIKLLVKGADNIIKSRLAEEQPFIQFIDQKLDEFSKIGLRTLLMATKILSHQEYEQFNIKYNSFGESENRQIELNKLTDALERDLHLIGATAVEDKLQQLVPETIADFLKANIKVWMLTGDKLETAENIAKSCKLIQGDMTVMRVSERTNQDLHKKFIENLEVFEYCETHNRKKSLLVEGESLALIIADEDLVKKFIHISSKCNSVVCCRVTPKQKAIVVKLIKDSLGKITLAIGDGANDVNMIQEAHIGIGLYGNEGMRAVQSSDFGLGEFRCLWRLLLVHGHWSYIRISEMILYFFYKNMVFTICQFFFSFFCGDSAQSFYDDWYITFFNMFFTALPLIITATFDQDINYRIYPILSNNEKIRKLEQKQQQYLRNKFPSFYYIGQKKTIFTIPNYIFWASQGTIHGLIIFFGCYYSIQDIINKDGLTGNLPQLSLTVVSVVVFVVNIKIALYTKFWTILNIVSILFFSLFVYFMYMLISQKYLGTLSLYTPFTLFLIPQYWLHIVLWSGVVFIFDVLFAQIVREIDKSPIDQMRNFVNNFKYTIEKFQNELDVNVQVGNVYKIQNSQIGSFWDEVRKEEEKQQIKQIPA